MSVEGWRTEPLSTIATIVMGQSPDSKYYSEEEVGLPFLQGCAEFTSKYPLPKLYCSQDKKVAASGSVLFSVRAPVGKTNLADRNYIIGRGLAALLAFGISQDYLNHYLSYVENDFRNASQGSTFEAINSKELNNWLISFPELPEEQTQIAAILSTIDRAIEQTEAIIAKQQRIKTGLMQDLLTKGIDEDGNVRSEETHEFKDSPLGRIPVKWDVFELEKISIGITSGSRGWAEFYSDDGAIFIRIGNLTRDHINLRLNEIKFVQPPQSAEGKRTAVQEGDLLISITADLGIIGVISRNFPEAYINQHIALIRLDKEEQNINPRFIGHYLASRGGQKQFEKFNESGAKAGLNLPTVGKLQVPVPSNSIEQVQICQFLDSIDNQVSEGWQELKKLNRIKTGLMQDLLTGKVRVTELLNHLPTPT